MTPKLVENVEANPDENSSCRLACFFASSAIPEYTGAEHPESSEGESSWDVLPSNDGLKLSVRHVNKEPAPLGRSLKISTLANNLSPFENVSVSNNDLIASSSDEGCWVIDEDWVNATKAGHKSLKKAIEK